MQDVARNNELVACARGRCGEDDKARDVDGLSRVVATGECCSSRKLRGVEACASVESGRMWALGQYYAYCESYLCKVGVEYPHGFLGDVVVASGVDGSGVVGGSVGSRCVGRCGGGIVSVVGRGGRGFAGGSQCFVGAGGLECASFHGGSHGSDCALGAGGLLEPGVAGVARGMEFPGSSDGAEVCVGAGSEEKYPGELASRVQRELCAEDSGVGLVDDGGCGSVKDCAGSVRGRHWVRNRKKKVNNKEKKKKTSDLEGLAGSEGIAESDASGVQGNKATGFFSELSDGDRMALKGSRANRMRAENELAMLKAEREIEVLKANDVSGEIKRYRTKVSAATERSMVSIEKTHALLRATGNVPGVQGGGFAKTVVSDDGCPSLESGFGSVSPDSSASQAEVRAMQKEKLDLQDKYDKLLEALEKIGLTERVLPYVGKELWSVDSNGGFLEKSESLFDEVYPNGFAIDPNVFIVDGKPKKRVLG